MTENKTISYPNLAVSLGLNEPIANLTVGAKPGGACGVHPGALVMTYNPYRPRRDRDR